MDNERFSDGRWASIPPAEKSAVVDVIHYGRFEPTGGLRGWIGTSTLDVAVRMPWPRGSATGIAADVPLTATWDFDSAGDSALSVRLRGQAATDAIDLLGTFRRQVAYQGSQAVGGTFLSAHVRGMLAGTALSLEVETDPPDRWTGNSYQITATGCLGDAVFDLNADGSRGIQGFFDGQAVSLDLAQGPDTGSRVVGVITAPPAFTVLTVACFLFFA